MIESRSPSEVEKIRAAGGIVAAAFDGIAGMMQAGVETREIDEAVEKCVLERGGELLFKGHKGFPASTCISVNEEVVHGIPGRRKLASGDIVSVDIGVRLDGWCADAARTYAVGGISEEKVALVNATRGALEAGVRSIRAGMKLVELGRAIQEYAEARGFSVVRTFVGHGIGRQMWEDPQIPNYVDGSVRQATTVLPEGCCLAIEPMVNAGTFEVRTLSNNWTVVTCDGRPSAHWEDTVAITSRGPMVLTRGDN